MTTSNAPAYKAPTGFYSSFGFDAEGNVLADGKKLNGVRLDATPFKQAAESATDWMGRPTKQTFQGGGINRLEADDKGNVYAIVGQREWSQNTTPSNLNPTQGGQTKGPNGQPQGGIDAGAAGQKVKLTGLAFDPARTSRNSTGVLPDNNVYLREERDGLYFAQVDTKQGTAAYAYSAYQEPTLPTSGPASAASNTTRKQGGNATRGGAGFDTSTISLLGN